MQPGGSDPQSYGSALIYARRYALAAIVGIATGEDDDAEDATRGKKEKVKTTYVGNRVNEKSEKKGKITKVDEQEKKDLATIEKLGETEVKDQAMLSEEEAQKEQAKLLKEDKIPAKPGRNQLNIRWHTLVKKLKDINYFSDDESYREWLWLEKNFKVKSSKELSDEKMSEGITLMAKIFNEQGKEK